jgi:hypothetical protein
LTSQAEEGLGVLTEITVSPMKRTTYTEENKRKRKKSCMIEIFWL